MAENKTTKKKATKKVAKKVEAPIVKEAVEAIDIIDINSIIVQVADKRYDGDVKLATKVVTNHLNKLLN